MLNPECTRSILLGLVIIILTPISMRSQTASVAEKQVLVRVTLNGAYRNSDSQALAILSLVKELPPTIVDIPPNDTISAFVARQYGFGRSDGLDKVYHSLEKSILDLNGLKEPEEWRPGKRLAPTLPHWAKTDFNPRKSENRIPVITQMSTVQFGDETSVKVAGTVPTSSIRPTSAPQSFSFDMKLSQAQALKLLSLSPQQFPGVLLSEPLLLTAPMNVNLATGRGQVSAVPLLPDNITSRLSILATKITGKQSILFVLDSGWPTADLRKQSILALKAIIDSIHKTYKLGSVLGDVTAEDSFASPSNDHCTNILNSIKELFPIDAGKIVNVIFVPLSKEQASQQILGELLYAHFLATSVSRTELGTVDLSTSEFKDIRKGAREATQHALQDISEKAEGSKLATDKAVLDALLTVADLYAESTGVHYFLNESWSVGKSSLFVMYPRTPRGIILAAVDNSGGLNVYQLGWDFAQRSLQSSDTVAVMNVDSMGQPLCRSNIVDDLPNTRAVSFDGSVSDGPCGTSYSSPRAAWLLAFAAALGPPSANPDNWANEFQLLITKFRGPGQGLGKYALSPDKYVTLLEATVQ